MNTKKLDILNEFCERWDFLNTDEDRFDILQGKINHLIKTIFNDAFISEETVNKLKSIKGDFTCPTKKLPLTINIKFNGEYLCPDDFNIYKLITNASDIQELMFYVQIIFTLEIVTPSQKEKLYDGLQDIIHTSNITNIVYLEKRESDIIILPAGESTLDKVLIAETMLSLQDYEVAYESYISAMKDFMNLASNNLVAKRDVGDKLRVSFETFLKSRFSSNKNSTKDLINQVVSPFLKEENVHVDIVSTYSSIANKFFSHANDTTKHNFKDISMEELEYLVYLMGSMIRLIHQLDQRPKLEIIEE